MSLPYNFETSCMWKITVLYDLGETKNPTSPNGVPSGVSEMIFTKSPITRALMDNRTCLLRPNSSNSIWCSKSRSRAGKPAGVKRCADISTTVALSSTLFTPFVRINCCSWKFKPGTQIAELYGLLHALRTSSWLKGLFPPSFSEQLSDVVQRRWIWMRAQALPWFLD